MKLSEAKAKRAENGISQKGVCLSETPLFQAWSEEQKQDYFERLLVKNSEPKSDLTELEKSRYTSESVKSRREMSEIRKQLAVAKAYFDERKTP